MLKPLPLERFLRHDEILVAEALLFLGERKIITVLRVFVYGLFIRADLPVFPFVLFGNCFNEIFIVFGIVRSIVFSGAVLLSFARRDLGAPLTPASGLCLRGFILDWIFFVIVVMFF